MSANDRTLDASLIEYLDECAEILVRVSKALVIIEQGGGDPETLAAIYRDIHTVKGSSQLFGFIQIGDVAHALESCLEPVRKGRIAVTPNLIDGLYSGCDIMSNLLNGIRETRREPDLRAEINILVPRLIENTEASFTKATSIASDKIHDENALDRTERSNAIQKKVPPAVMPGRSLTGNTSMTAKDQGFGFFDDEPATTATDIRQEEAVPPPSKVESSPSKAVSTAKSKSTESNKSTSEDNQSETIRVHVSILDNLMNLVGEQVLIRNQLLQHAKSNDFDTDLAKLSQRLNILTAELQNEVMKTRMQPVGNVLNKFNRVVRDLGRELEKRIELTIVGAETELDKTIIEAIKDPLTHIVRNSIDHGIESPHDRRVAKKSEVGHLFIKASHESGQVIIDIADDGRGLDPKKIGAKAVERGLINENTIEKLSDREIQNLIFAPGFSTAATVSSISGRGVGMDVVKTNIERIGGLIELNSEAGKGTTIRFKIPLTLAIVPALIVKASDQCFAIPQSMLIELVLVDESNKSEERIELLQGSPVLRLRGKILPLLGLSTILNMNSLPPQLSQNSDSIETGKGNGSQATNIVVLNADGFQFGLIVDSVEDTADIVVKALPGFLKDLTYFSGATIMGDGKVALTIDVMSISSDLRVKGEMDNVDGGIAVGKHRQRQQTYRSDEVEFLMVDVGAPSSYALPLTVVARLEEFEADEFEFSGEQKVIRYRGSLLHIFSLPSFLKLPFPNKHDEAQAKVPVVVVKRGDNLYGIEVFEIRDVLSMQAKIDQTVRDRPGILGTMIVGGEIVVVVDVLNMIDSLRSKLAVASGVDISAKNTSAKSKQVEQRKKRKILLVEDSPFFRNYVRQVLEEASYSVDVAADGSEALSSLEDAGPEYYSLVLSDIEMPVMDGYELARKVRSDEKFKSIKMAAITTRFSNDDIECGRTAGFDIYLEKLNAEKLLETLDELLQEPMSRFREESKSKHEVNRAKN